MLIRAARAADFDAIADLVNHYIRTTAIHFGYEPVVAAELLEHAIEHRARYPFLVAEVDGAFAGFSKAGVWRERPAYAWTTECTVYVQPGLHARGLGRALYQRLFAILEAQRYCSVIAGITLPNAASVRLHESLGFTKVGHVARAGWKLDRWHDLGLWQKALAPADRAPGEIRAPVYE